MIGQLFSNVSSLIENKNDQGGAKTNQDDDPLAWLNQPAMSQQPAQPAYAKPRAALENELVNNKDKSVP